MLVLLYSLEASVEENIIHLDLKRAKQMWEHLRQRYQPPIYSLLQQLQTLEQGDDSVEAFFDKFMAIQINLDSHDSVPDVCKRCACCEKHRQHNGIRRLHDFLIRLRPEFGPAKARLLSRSPLPDMVDALNALRAEEIWLQSIPRKPC
ncbi:hypothetical protein BS78_04G097100 [Paspalum vaginatum]|nr:hypothetical protein BS78_04G097100 [Paspalum vaginatum]